MTKTRNTPSETLSEFLSGSRCTWSVLVLFCLGVGSSVAAQEIEQWLATEPVVVPMPAYSDVKNLHGNTYSLTNVLDVAQLDIRQLRPRDGETLQWTAQLARPWKVQTSDPDHPLTFSPQSEKTPELAFAATYITVDRWVKAKLEVKGAHYFQVLLDGDVVNSKKSSNTPDDSGVATPSVSTSDLELETGKHLLVIKMLRDPDNAADWTISALLTVAEEFGSEVARVDTDPVHFMNMKHHLNQPFVTEVSISPAGDLVGISLWKFLPPGDRWETWLEVRRVRDGSLVRSYRGDTLLSKIRWAPSGRKFAYTSDKLGKSLWVVDLDKETSTPVFTDTAGISSYAWSPDGSFIIYRSSESGPGDTHGVHHLLDVDDQQPGWRDRSYLNLLNVEQGTRFRLTSGELSTFLNDISPDSRRILFSRYRPDYTQRPFSEVTYHVMDLATLEVTDLWTSRWAGGAVWSPDGKKFLIAASPSQFGKAGLDPDAGAFSSEYDTQAFVYDPKTRQVDPISLDFDPKIDSAVWSNVDQKMYFLTTDKDYGNMYCYDPARRVFTKLETGVEVVSHWDIAFTAPVIAYAGSGVSSPTQIYTLNTKTGTRTLMLDTGTEEFRDVRFGKVEPQNFCNADDIEIEGMLYYPPNFDPTKKYPCIVYYYGGTTPTQRIFFEKFNLYAANGYMVYVLQPSGAVGYGQKFSSLHVNDWGTKVAEEIILGVKTLLVEHPYIDPSGVGCTGTSYGGFMTMLLTTRTDLFAAAISHAGISDIANHWGQSYYGLGYCSAAAADSYPWNRRDIFVDQSPIFSADKIHTPLLLTHGTVDTNVLPGQSMQMYAALRLLGREVEFLQFTGENHGIENYDRRVAWKKSALAWFDKHLKNQPQWWEKQYGLK